MAVPLQPGPRQGRIRRGRRGYALAVSVAAALLVLCAVLPWAGIEARSEVIGGGLTSDVRGVDAGLGVFTLVAGLVALALGVAGLLGRRPWVAALAALPGAFATVLLVMFAADPGGVTGRVSLDLGGMLSVGPVIRYGWFAALASSLALVLFAVLAAARRSPATG
ncbi:hypothetical protein GCM10010149_61790 [Nonomuraea roseoviolacea subsp. roseoviolacea]|uniref:hypothetical protein n=1 Tax=Nonomuraea roseoviolacea TaxID=103837 RepID=UPI0031D49637